jgi:eukaryotic-like serine/threonine-protein kinase
MSSKPSTPMDSASESPTSRDASLSLLPGELLAGKYRIDAHLAEGGMGVVLRATHLDLDCPVAIKLLRPEHSQNEDIVARLLAEARIAASLRSKHVNRVLDVGRTTAGIPYLVLEYLEGSDLGGYLERRGPLPVSEAADYVMQACEALAEAHAIGIVHRDMKPENLFLAEEADGGFLLKVLDFGISKAPVGRRGRTLTNPSEVVGSPTYMSPEQLRGGTVDARTDVWALGAVLYELCTGDIFFDEESLTTTFKRILDPNDMPPPLEGGEEARRLHAIIVRCLERVPERRFQDMAELAQALAPLGVDALQAGRVAKVAAAAKARFIAAASGSAPPQVGTPFALTMSHVDVALLAGARELAPKRRWSTWSVVAAAAVVAATVGASRQWMQRDVGAATAPSLATAPVTPVAALTAIAEEERASPLPVPRPASTDISPQPIAQPWSTARAARPAVAVVASSPLVPAATTALRVEPTQVEDPSSLPTDDGTVAAHHATAVAAQELTAHLAAAEPTAGASPTSQVPFDAWDPNTFGGRK